MIEPVTWATEDLQNVMSPKFKEMHKDINSSTQKQFPIPLYAHPMRELTDEEIRVFMAEMPHLIERKDLLMFARAIIKASRGEK